MVSKRWLRRTDFVLIGAVAAILIISLITIGSATHINNPSDERYWYVERQGIFTIMNVAVAIFLMNFDYKILGRYGNKLYIFNIIMSN